MEYLLSYNFGNIAVTDRPCSDYLSVMINENNYENFKWGGVIEVREQQKFQDGVFSFFRTNPAWREVDAMHWNYTENEATILCYVQDMIAYIIVGEDNKPVLVPRDYSYFDEVEIRVKNNVVQLELLSKTCA